MTRRVLVACCMTIASYWSASVHAADRRPSIVVTADHHAELGRRLSAEARQAGMRVLDAPRVTDSDSENGRATVVATLRVISATEIEVLIQKEQGEPLLETWHRRPGEGDLFPLRVIEDVRARLVDLELWPEQRSELSRSTAEVGTGALPAVDPSASDRPAEPVVEARPSSGWSPVDAASTHGTTGASGFWVVGGAGVTLPEGGMGTTPNAWLGARFDWASRFGAELSALVPLTETEISEPEGDADIRATAFVGHLDYAPASGRAARLRVGAGGGLLLLSLRGEAEPGFVAADDMLVSGLAYAELGAAFGLGSWMRLGATALLGMSAPRPVLRFDGDDVAAWGPWFVAASLRGEFRLGWVDEP